MASPADLVVDTSALMAILLPEADGPSFYARLTAARSPAISSVGKVELLIVLTSRQPATAQALFSRLRQCAALSVISVDETIADLAIAAFARYGRDAIRPDSISGTASLIPGAAACGAFTVQG
ncbi:MAG: type II toxin-antitoxin system VapC family toxin [Gammaproteobacteria bacterium]